MSYKALYSPNEDSEDGSPVNLGTAATASPRKNGDVSSRSLFTQEDKDLLPKAKSQVEQAFRRRIIAVFALGVGILAVTAIVVALVIFEQHKNKSKPARSPPRNTRNASRFSFEDIFKHSFTPEQSALVWMPNSSMLIEYSVDRGLVARSPDGLTEKVLVVFSDNKTESYLKLDLELESISPDENYALMSLGGKTSLFRHGSQSAYVAVKLTDNGPPHTMGDVIPIFNFQQLRIVRWANSGSQLIFIPADKPNIYYQPDVENEKDVQQLTDNGQLQFLLNGVADWLYEEDVISTDTALWSSPDDGHLAYITFNETSVEFFHWVEYGDPSDDYVSVEKIRYPKAGYANPAVTMKVRSLTSPVTFSLQPPVADETYITNVAWLNATHLSVMWMIRLQTDAYLTAYNVSSSTGGLLEPTMSLHWAAPVGWVTIDTSALFPVNGGQAVVLLLPRQEDPHYVHIALVTTTNRVTDLKPEFLTKGPWEVSKIHRVDTEDQFLIVEATVAGPEYRHLYRVALDKRDATSLTCLTCNAGRSCGYNSFKVSGRMDYILWNCQGPELPKIQVAQINDLDSAKVVSVLVNNSPIAAAIKEISLPRHELIRIPVLGRMLPALRLSPAAITTNRSNGGKLPTLVWAYNGPLTQTVKAQHPLLFNDALGRWFIYLVSTLNFQVFVVDGRGTPYLGDSFGKAQFRTVGEVESIDQIGAANYMISNYSADSTRMAFWGWSFGGFLSAYIATQSDNVFKVCIATAPVTDWRYYDSAYTERMMGLPNENGFYETNSIIGRAGKFGKTKFLVIHGSGDDNVHFQNTAQLSAALTKHDVQFRMQVYTDKTHSLFGTHTQRHFLTLQTNFMLDAFDLKQ